MLTYVCDQQVSFGQIMFSPRQQNFSRTPMHSPLRAGARQGTSRAAGKRPLINILQNNVLLRLSTNFRSVHLLHANKVIFTAGFVLWYSRWAPRRVLSLQHLLKRAFRLLGQWIRILDFYPIDFTHDSKKHPGSTSACLLLVVFLARRFLIISLYLGQNAPKKM